MHGFTAGAGKTAPTSTGPGLPGVMQLLRIAAGLVFLVGFMWLLEGLDWLLPGDMDQHGIVSRDLDHVTGVLTAPFLHDGFGHLANNSVPLLVLGFLAAMRGAGRFVIATVVVIGVGGGALWLLGPADHVIVGASGLVFGYFGYVVARGVFDRRVLDIVLGVIVIVLYGSILWGVIPRDDHISQEGHLAGLLAGVLAAWMMRRTRARAAE